LKFIKKLSKYTLKESPSRIISKFFIRYGISPSLFKEINDKFHNSNYGYNIVDLARCLSKLSENSENRVRFKNYAGLLLNNYEFDEKKYSESVVASFLGKALEIQIENEWKVIL